VANHWANLSVSQGNRFKKKAPSGAKFCSHGLQPAVLIDRDERATDEIAGSSKFLWHAKQAFCSTKKLKAISL
jgi:hypothetical protein